MAKRPLTHGFWLVITIATFVAGSRWAGSSVSAKSEHAHSSAPADKNSERGGGPSARSLDMLKARLSAVVKGGGSERGSGATLAALSPELARLLDSTKGRSLTQEQIEALVIAAIRSGSAIERRKAFDRLLEEMGSENLTSEQAIAIRTAMAENRAGREMWRLFDYAWGANRPEDALAHIEKVPERWRNGFIGNVIAGMASTDPDAAIDYVASVDPALRPSMINRLIEGLADHDPAVATDYVMGLAESGDPKARDYMQRLAKEILGTSGFEEGKAWVESLPPGPLLGHALMPIANEFANRDPEGAAKWAESFAGTPGAARVFGEVVREWGDWREASAWVDSLPAGQAQLDGISAVWGFRGSSEPQVAVQEIIGMPPSKEKDYAINGFISGLAHRDGEAATIWAAEITEPHMRTSAVIRAGKQFYKQDPEGAQSWFNGASGLPADSWKQVKGGK